MSTEIDLLITNMIIFSQLDASFPVKVSKNVEIEKKMSNDDLVFLLSPCCAWTRGARQMAHLHLFSFAHPHSFRFFAPVACERI